MLEQKQRQLQQLLALKLTKKLVQSNIVEVAEFYKNAHGISNSNFW